MISLLSLTVAILAVFFGPLVSWTVARRQISTSTRENWMREFRNQVASLLHYYDKFVEHSGKHTTGNSEDEIKLSEIKDKERINYHNLCLLISERGNEFDEFKKLMEEMLFSASDKIDVNRKKFVDYVECILRKERAIVSENPEIWHDLCASLGLKF